MFKPKITITLFLLLAMQTALQAQINKAYTKEIEAWHTKRINDLKSESGWLNLVGLYWLKAGKQTFGSGAKMDVRFPGGSILTDAGTFTLRPNHSVIISAKKSVGIRIKNKAIQAGVIFHPDSSINPTLIKGNYLFNVIKRENKIGIRLRDLKSPDLTNFKGIDRFAIDTAWRITGTLKKANQSQVMITNVLGQTIGQPSQGTIHFSLHGKSYTLDPIEDGKDLLVVFADSTSGNETYGAGRFLTLQRPSADGKVILDFNKAYNPPCAFTEFATCPLPPPQNFLSFRIPAGEKNYGNH